MFIDPATNEVLATIDLPVEVVATIEPLGNNAVPLVDGSLWTADGDFGLVQRFDGAAETT